MKKVLFLLPLFLILGLIFVGCSTLNHSGVFPTSEAGQVPSWSKATASDPAEYPLYADQDILVGKVLVWDDGDNLCVKYETDDLWYLAETHLAVAADLEAIPTTKKGSPIAGQFPYGDDSLEDITSSPEYCISLSGFAEPDTLIIAAFAVVEKPEGKKKVIEEGAWAAEEGGGTLFVTKGDWATYFEYTVTYEDDKVVTIKAIPGVTSPIAGATPVTAITETDEFTGTVSWSPADAPFGYSTVYTATITLTAKEGYTFNGVVENFFTVADATANNSADSGVVTAVFPETAGTTGPVYNQTKETYHSTIQTAINASSSGDVIVVSKGTYNENIILDNKNITLKSSNPNDSVTQAATIIDGQDKDSVVRILNNDTSTLEGFTIQNGNEPDYGGGGIFISGSSPVIRYNVIGDNIDDDVDTGNTGDCGGGLCIVDGSETPHIYENIIIGNTARYGGAMYIGWGSPIIEDNIIKDNISESDGGGISVLYSKYGGYSYCATIRGNIIQSNTAESSGGGIAVSDEGSAIIENNKINNNVSNYDGGGVYVFYKSDADIRGDNWIEDNEAGRNGGGIYIYSNDVISITANIIRNNTANIESVSYSGGGIYVNATFMTSTPAIGGTDSNDTNNFNTICGNSPDQIVPDDYPYNDINAVCP